MPATLQYNEAELASDALASVWKTVSSDNGTHRIFINDGYCYYYQGQWDL